MTSPPVKYVRQASYTDFSTAHPNDQQSGTNLDADFGAVLTSLNATIDRLAQVQRSDGALANAIVTPDGLSAASLALMAGTGVPRGAWLTLTAYIVKDLVAQNGLTYICVTAHTSGVFATDLAAGKWLLLSSGITPFAYDSVNKTIGLNAAAVSSAAVPFRIEAGGFIDVGQEWQRISATRINMRSYDRNLAAYKTQGFDASDFAWALSGADVMTLTQSAGNAPIITLLQNTNAGNAATAVVQLKNSAASIASFTLNGGAFTTAGVLRQDGAVLSCSGAGGLTLNTAAVQPIYFAINGVATGLFTTNRVFHASVDGTYFDSTGDRHELSQSSASSFALISTNKNAATPFGVIIVYTGTSPNGTGNEFITCQDGGSTIRATIRSNGGLANFSANNVNLSDISVKPEFQKHTDIELVALEASFVAVDWGKFKYADQTHNDWNYGYSAQGVEAAFAATVPAMTDVWNPTIMVEVDDGAGKMVRDTVATPVKDQLRAVYTEDLNNIAHALLARALRRISDLEARLAAAGIP